MSDKASIRYGTLLTIRVSDDEFKMLDEVAEQTSRTRSNLMRLLMKKYLPQEAMSHKCGEVSYVHGEQMH